ncbi:alpha-amylase family glycosyl hydrolase [Bacillus massiliigorillae]|uniref:alpha-amylase family glycosyl hydrolase n=1 Tax=Bacillus massiliigorillae TaxID=1243664 RepID=UPI00039CB16D|nr:alpha-amylase family glycosyl hydrolase [Bacillus massiliigorillae]
MENQISSRFTIGNFRYPSGAVPTNSNINFNIQVPRYYGLKEVFLVCIKDEDNHYDYLRMNWKGIESGRDVFEVSMEVKNQGLLWYYFQLKSLDHVTYVGKDVDGIIETEVEPPSWQITIYDEAFKTPDWIKGGIFYHIFVDRFAKVGSTPVKNHIVMRNDWNGVPIYAPNKQGEVMNNDFFGGNLKGIISKLDYLHSLGITCLYLSPIFEAYSNHKYDTGDYTKIDPMFGTLEDFHELCEQGKQRGIRILLDGVFNHTGSDSVYFNKKATYNSVGAYQSENSEYYHWFKFLKYPDKYESWWGIDTLPAIQEDNPSYIEFITGEHGIGRRWLKEGASGWRLDVADELPDDFLERFRSAVKNINEDALIVGEVWEDASYKIAYGKRRHYFYGQQLDSVMNYPFMNAIIRFIRYGDAENLDVVVTSIVQNYPDAVVHCLMNMIGTHDTRRILTSLGGKELANATKEEKSLTVMTPEERVKGILLLKLASLLQMTLPGVPCVYYGDEVGMEGYEDPFNRRCYPWGNEDKELLNWYKKLGCIRKKLSVFKEGSYKTIYAEEKVFIFQRVTEKEKVVVGVNRSDKPFAMDVVQLYEDVLHNEKVTNEYIIQPNACCFLVHS